MESDLIRRRRALHALRQEGNGPVAPVPLAPDVLRDEVRASWERCAPAVSTATSAAPTEDVDLRDGWDASPIRRSAPDVVAELESTAVGGDFVAGISDATGRLLWSGGGHSLRNRTEQVNFAPGGQWDETSVGTNAIGLSLVLGRPVEVFADEHWCEAVKDWVCYSAPVRNAGGAVVGVIDLSTTWRRATEAGMSVVSALARLAEHELSRVRFPLATRATLDLQLLGSTRLAVLDGVPLLLTPRQLDYLCILETREELSLDQLRVLVDGDRALGAATVRSELASLRRAIGGGLDLDPYRLTIVVTSDRARVLRRLAAGDLEAAVESYGGPLLPHTGSPTLLEERELLDELLRTALLERGTTEQLLAYGRHHPDDRQLFQTAIVRATSLAAVLPMVDDTVRGVIGDPRLPG